jgi:hypothetical protein
MARRSDGPFPMMVVDKQEKKGFLFTEAPSE